MDTLEAIRSRRAVRAYDPAQRLSDAEQRELLELAMLSPTAFNLQHWRFMVVEEAELRRQIRAVAWDQAQVTDAALLIVLCADLASWEKQAARVWQDAPAPVQEALLPAIDSIYRDQPQNQRDEAMRSCGIAAQSLMLAARGMGYDSCPMDGFDFAAVAGLINLPADHCIGLMLAIGRSVAPAGPRIGRLGYDEVVLRDRF